MKYTFSSALRQVCVCVYAYRVVILVSRRALYVLVWIGRLLDVLLSWTVVAAVFSFFKMLRKVLRCVSQVPALVASAGQVSSAWRGPAASARFASAGLGGSASPAGMDGDRMRHLVDPVVRPAHLSQDLWLVNPLVHSARGGCAPVAMFCDAPALPPLSTVASRPTASSLGQAGKRAFNGYRRGDACTRVRVSSAVGQRYSSDVPPYLVASQAKAPQVGNSSLSAHPYKAHQGPKCRYAHAPKRNQAFLLY